MAVPAVVLTAYNAELQLINLSPSSNEKRAAAAALLKYPLAYCLDCAGSAACLTCSVRARRDVRRLRDRLELVYQVRVLSALTIHQLSVRQLVSQLLHLVLRDQGSCRFTLRMDRSRDLAGVLRVLEFH